jgi:glyoxylase-like metal-dependent hydrolase (beta-lactamase superfamily II)
LIWASCKLLVGNLSTGRYSITKIYVTHPHQDHVFETALLDQAFPNAEIVALAATINGARSPL